MTSTLIPRLLFTILETRLEAVTYCVLYETWLVYMWSPKLHAGICMVAWKLHLWALPLMINKPTIKVEIQGNGCSLPNLLYKFNWIIVRSIWKNQQPPTVFLHDAKPQISVVRHYTGYRSTINSKLTFLQKVLIFCDGMLRLDTFTFTFISSLYLVSILLVCHPYIIFNFNVVFKSKLHFKMFKNLEFYTLR